MKSIVLKSFIFAVLVAALTYLVSQYLGTSANMPDVGALSAFVTAFGTLYGIMTAFIVIEVWSEYNKTSELVAKEALGLERLYRLTLYFRDAPLARKMHKALQGYASVIIKSNFDEEARGKRLLASSKPFRDISQIIRDVKFDDSHDETVFDHVVGHYGRLSEIRTERISQSVVRLPAMLRLLLYLSSILILLTFVVMPYANIIYGLFVSGTLAFFIAMVLFLIDDLDNPFKGVWNVTAEPYERAMRHIEEDYQVK